MGKYNYKTNYKEAIKQGVSKEEYSREASKNCIQTWIANELADLADAQWMTCQMIEMQTRQAKEANRLNRMEMRQNELKKTQCDMKFLDDLEDQA